MSSDQELQNERPSGSLDEMLTQHLDPLLQQAALPAPREGCPDTAVLQQLADGLIRETAEVSELDAHTKSCNRCGRLLRGFQLTRSDSLGQRVKQWLFERFSPRGPRAQEGQPARTGEVEGGGPRSAILRFAALTAVAALAAVVAAALLWPRATVGGIPESAIYGHAAPERRLALWREHGDHGLFPRVATLRGADAADPEVNAVLPEDSVDLEVPLDIRLPVKAKPEVRNELGESIAVQGEWTGTRTYRFRPPKGGWPAERLYYDIPGVTSTLAFEALPRKGVEVVRSEIRSGRRSPAQLTQLFYMFGLKQRALREAERLEGEGRRRWLERLKVDAPASGMVGRP
jgi:hypothetical protein